MNKHFTFPNQRPVLRNSRGEIQAWKLYETHVRDSFYGPYKSLERCQSSSEIGPSILLQDVYPEDLTASFGGRVRLKDEYTLRKRIQNPLGYLDRTYVDARSDIYPASRFYNITRDSEYHDKASDDYFHMYRPWRVHLPPTYSSTWEKRYEKGLKSNLTTTAALMEARKRDHTIELVSGEYRSPAYWKSRFGDHQSITPYVKNPWYLSAEHYNHSHRGY